ncbi:MAG: spermidine synthase [Oceanobacter sp.]
MSALTDWFSPRNEVHRRYDSHGLIQVFDHGEKRYLSFGTTDEQSCILRGKPLLLQHPYTRAMMAVLSQVEPAQPPKQISLMGLGGGSLANCLIHLFPDSQVWAVELREAVIHVARQYFGLPRADNLQITPGDAMEQLANAEPESCDLMFSDLYLAAGIEIRQFTAEYLQHCENHLKPGGWLVLNLWREHRQYDHWFDELKKRFDTCLHASTTDGNWIIWVRKPAGEALASDAKTSRQRCTEWSEKLGFNLWQSARPFVKKR